MPDGVHHGHHGRDKSEPEPGLISARIACRQVHQSMLRLLSMIIVYSIDQSPFN